ncbi:PAS domain-containing sensor histidine kinase [Hymenobacter tenuis]
MNDDVRLLEGDRRFRALFEHNPDFVLFQNDAGIILDANPAFLALVHQEKEAVLNRPFADFLPPEARPLFHEKLMEAFQGHPVQFETGVQLLGAEFKVLNVTKVPLWMGGKIVGVHVVSKDITSAAIAQQVIQDQAKKLNTIFESITDAFFLLDTQGTFTYVNGEVERLLGIARGQLLGKRIKETFSGDFMIPFYKHFDQAIDTGTAVHFEEFFEPRQLWLEVKAFPSEEGLSVYFSNATEKIKAHQQLYRHNQDLQQFAYIVSHNLRAPLTNMLGLVDLLIDLAKDAPEYDNLLAHLRSSTEQLDTVLRDMNTILTIRDKQETTEPELVPLKEVVEQATQSLHDALQEAGAEVHCTIPDTVRVRGNRAYLYSIFFNLLSNSLKYRIKTRPLRINISAADAHTEPGVQVIVADNGSGFDMQRAGNEVFKLYKRFHDHPSGRGMGLYLVKNHVEAMGGHIEVYSEVNHGTRFTVQLA